MNRISVFAQSIYHKVKAGAAKTPTTASFNFTGFARLQDDHNAPAPIPLVNQVFPKPLTLRKNQTEEKRLQGLMLKNKEGSPSNDNDKQESIGSAIKKWYINEGDRRSFFAVWVLLHALVWGLGYTHYQLKGKSPSNDGLVLVLKAHYQTT
jgi:NADPH oxidase